MKAFVMYLQTANLIFCIISMYLFILNRRDKQARNSRLHDKNNTLSLKNDCHHRFYLSFFLKVWHWCLPNGQQFSFLCPNGTVFNQYARVCDWWFNVDCANTPSLYGINEDLYKVPPYYDQQQQQRN